MSEHTLPRTGDRPLAFAGEWIAGASTGGHDATRWHTLSLYLLDGGRYVVAIGYRSRWQGETNHDDAAVLDDAAALAGWLRAYDPCQYLLGYPPGEAYEEKRRRLERDIVLRFRSAVSELLADVEPERIA